MALNGPRNATAAACPALAEDEVPASLENGLQGVVGIGRIELHSMIATSDAIVKPAETGQSQQGRGIKPPSFLLGMAIRDGR